MSAMIRGSSLRDVPRSGSTNRKILWCSGHQRALGAVAVAAASKNRDQAGGLELTKRSQDISQCILGVRIIHEYLKLRFAGTRSRRPGTGALASWRRRREVPAPIDAAAAIAASEL